MTQVFIPWVSFPSELYAVLVCLSVLAVFVVLGDLLADRTQRRAVSVLAAVMVFGVVAWAWAVYLEDPCNVATGFWWWWWGCSLP